jgi:ATP-dependent Clp protease ATP-binding subunit ClpC
MTEVTTVYDRFTALAKRAMVAARDAADHLGHDYIGTEHLLLGLAQTAGRASEVLRAHGVELERMRTELLREVARSKPAHGTAHADRTLTAKAALSSLGIDIDAIQRNADATFGPGRFTYPRPGFTVPAKQAVASSLRAAKESGEERIDTEHLLLGVLDTDSTATRVLAGLGVEVEAVRQALRDHSPLL